MKNTKAHQSSHFCSMVGTPNLVPQQHLILIFLTQANAQPYFKIYKAQGDLDTVSVKMVQRKKHFSFILSFLL